MITTHFRKYLTLISFALVGLVALASPGPGDIDGDNDVDLTDLAQFVDCLNGPDLSPHTACTVDADFDDDGDVDLADYQTVQGNFTGKRVQLPLPAQWVQFDLIGIHDSASDDFNADCISCHDERGYTVTLDGETPTAHAKMTAKLLFDPESNDRCIFCHPFTDFLTQSAGGFRKTVDIDSSATGCTICHGSYGDPTVPWYVR